MLTLAYIALAVVGCGYIVITALLGHLFEAGDGDGDGHEHGRTAHEGGDSAVTYGLDGSGHGTASADGVGGAEFHFPFFSPLALATLGASIGAYGLIALYGLRVEEPTSLLIAVPAAIATAYAVTYVGWRIVSGSRASSVIRTAQLRGALAEVTTPIPAGGLGEAVAAVAGQRYSAPAREETGREVPRGTLVTVVGMLGPTLVVRAGAARQENQTHA